MIVIYLISSYKYTNTSSVQYTISISISRLVISSSSSSSSVASRNILRKITKLVNNSNDQQRCASASIFCEDPFSSSTPYAEELEYNIDFLIDHQDIRQCHFPGDQNRAEDRYEEEAYNPNEEGQHVFQSLSPD